MKTKLLSLLLAAVAPAAFAQVTETTTTTTTTSSGTLTEYVPGSTFVMKETSGPVTYRYGQNVTYVTKTGKTLTAEKARTYIKVGSPVTVHYSGTPEARVIERIEVDADDGEMEVEVND
jgi:hypothetical protein